jgi:hypothetical protein
MNAACVDLFLAEGKRKRGANSLSTGTGRARFIAPPLNKAGKPAYRPVSPHGFHLRSLQKSVYSAHRISRTICVGDEGRSSGSRRAV